MEDPSNTLIFRSVTKTPAGVASAVGCATKATLNDTRWPEAYGRPLRGLSWRCQNGVESGARSGTSRCKLLRHKLLL